MGAARVKQKYISISGLKLLGITAVVLFTACGAWASAFQGVLRPYRSPGCDNVEGAIKGMYTIGLIGPTCPAISMGASLRTQFLYTDFIIDAEKIAEAPQEEGSKKSLLTESSNHYVNGYGVRTVNLIDQIAADYLNEQVLLEGNERNNQPLTSDELQAWQLLVKVIAYQESLFTHYQNSSVTESDDLKMRLLVGDAQFERACSGEGENRQCRVKKDSRGRAIVKRDASGRPVYAAIGMYQHFSTAKKHSSSARYEDLDLVKNIEKGMSYVYPRWAQILGHKKMINSALRLRFNKCRSQVHRSTGVNYIAAIRAAYGMYNGGDSDICRFAESDIKYKQYKNQNPGCFVGQIAFANEAKKRSCESKQRCGAFACPWVNDTRIETIATTRPWENRLGITDSERHAKYKNKSGRFEFAFDLGCVRRGETYCLNQTDHKKAMIDFFNQQEVPKLYTVDVESMFRGHAEKNFCVFNDKKQKLICTEREELVPCLRNQQNFELNKIYKNKVIGRAYYTLHTMPIDLKHFEAEFSNDAQRICKGSADGVFLPGQLIVTQKKMKILREANLRSRSLGEIQGQSTLQVLDLHIDLANGLDRWYKVSKATSNGQYVEGYIYGGDDLDWSTLVSEKQVALSALSQPSSSELKSLVLPLSGQSVELLRDRPVYSTLTAITNSIEHNFIAPVSKGAGATFALPTGSIVKVVSLHLVGRDQMVVLEVNLTRNESSQFIQVGQLRTKAQSIRDSVGQFVRITGG